MKLSIRKSEKRSVCSCNPLFFIEKVQNSSIQGKDTKPDGDK